MTIVLPAKEKSLGSDEVGTSFKTAPAFVVRLCYSQDIPLEEPLAQPNGGIGREGQGTMGEREEDEAEGRRFSTYHPFDTCLTP